MKITRDNEDNYKFSIGDMVHKPKGSNWHGTVVGYYSTNFTPEGYCVESFFEKSSVQIYPASALEEWHVGEIFK